MEGFQTVMTFLMMPMFFLSGAIFPLTTLPGWLTVLTCLDPVSYAVDALRRVVLGQAGVPDGVMDQLGMTLFGYPLSLPTDLAIVAVFAAAMLALAVASFRGAQ